MEKKTKKFIDLFVNLKRKIEIKLEFPIFKIKIKEIFILIKFKLKIS